MTGSDDDGPIPGGLLVLAWGAWVLSAIATVWLSIAAIRGWGGAIDFQWAGSGRRAVELLRSEGALADARTGLDDGRWLPIAYAIFAISTAVVTWSRVTRTERWVERPSERPGEAPTRIVSQRRRAWSVAAVVAVLVAAGLDRYEDDRTRDIIAAVESSPLDSVAPPALDASDAQDAIREARELGDKVDRDANLVLFSAASKWLLLVLAAAWGVQLLRQPLRPPPGRGRADLRTSIARVQAGGEVRTPVAAWQPPLDGHAPRIGISCSGGGVRSAAFCLGALQRLDEPDERAAPDSDDGHEPGEAAEIAEPRDERSKTAEHPSILQRAEYLTAVSGGSYMASALATAEWSGTWPEYADREGYGRRGSGDERIEGTDRRAFAQGSPEESWFRRNSAYLASDASEVAAGVMHTLAGLAVNLLVLWLLLFALTRPVGWLLSSGFVHPELRAREPSVHVVDQPTLGATRDEAAQVLGAEELEDGTWEFTFEVVPCDECHASVEVWRPTLGSAADPEDRTVRLQTARPGVGRVEDGAVRILRQPRLEVRAEHQIVPEVKETANAARPTIVVETQPHVIALGGVATSPADGIADRIEATLRVTERPSIRQYSGTTGRPPVDISGRDVRWGLGFLAGAFVLYLVKIFANPTGVILKNRLAFPVSGVFSGLIAASGFVGLVLLAVFLVLPWCVQEIPPWVSSTFGRAPLAEPAAGTERSGSSAVVGFLGIFGLSLSSIVLTLGRKLRSRPMTAAKVVAVVLLVGIGVITTVSLIQMAAANGPTGRLTGFGLGPTIRSYPDYLKWLVALAALGLLTFGDAHSWSIFPYYRRRLSRAFVVHRRQGGTAEPLPYEIPVHFRRGAGAGPAPSDAGGPVSPVARARPHLEGSRWRGPELVVCAAANVIDEGVAPPGRRSVSFTFSGSVVGGPEVGWMPTDRYLARLGPRRQRDLTIPAAMATSGAAVSPAMGKMGLGPLGRLLAVLNVRLGVWLPNPSWVRQMDGGERPWWGRPGWPWFVREVLGQHKADGRYLYVTDGGHWENLGLVELFRRGCTEIYCLSAAGDGAASFGTLGEAIALAREELGVEVDVELEELRAGTGEPGAPSAPLPVALGPEPEPDGPVARITRTLRRKSGATVQPSPTATRAWAKGTFTYPAEGDRPAVHGTLYVIEATLTADIPWDVQAHAEKWVDFPDDSTADQLFSHRQFESYRALGHHQVDRLLRERPA